MEHGREIRISGRTYRINPKVGRYQIHVDELGELRMNEVPAHSHLEVLGLPEPEGASSMECYALNAGDEGNNQNLSVYGGASFKVARDEEAQIVSRLRGAFPPTRLAGLKRPVIPVLHADLVDGEVVVNLFVNIDFEEKPDALVREAVAPFLDGYRRLGRPSVRAFICHASEDKPAARELASAMTGLGVEVWFDEWEIRVGDSIVQKIGAALGTVSHLIVLLSVRSVDKPWVQKELSSALMQQLSRNSIRVLPVRLDDCVIPPILADIKYADARPGMQHALTELEQALFSSAASVITSAVLLPTYFGKDAASSLLEISKDPNKKEMVVRALLGIDLGLKDPYECIWICNTAAAIDDKRLHVIIRRLLSHLNDYVRRTARQVADVLGIEP